MLILLLISGLIVIATLGIAIKKGLSQVITTLICSMLLGMVGLKIFVTACKSYFESKFAQRYTS